MRQSYDIQKSIQTNSMWRGAINMSDLLLVALYFIVLFRISNIFPVSIRPYVVIANVILLIFWIFPSKENHKRKQGQTLFSILFRRPVTYHSIDKEGNSVGGK